MPDRTTWLQWRPREKQIIVGRTWRGAVTVPRIDSLEQVQRQMDPVPSSDLNTADHAHLLT